MQNTLSGVQEKNISPKVKYWISLSGVKDSHGYSFYSKNIFLCIFRNTTVPMSVSRLESLEVRLSELCFTR